MSRYGSKTWAREAVREWMRFWRKLSKDEARIVRALRRAEDRGQLRLFPRDPAQPDSR